MPRDIIKNWETASESPITISKLSGIIRPQMPLKEKIAQSIFRLKIQQNKLENSALKMQRHDRNLFDKCIAAQMSKDSARATLFANECAEIRKMASTFLRCQLALEKVIIRLENIEIFSESAQVLGPVAGVVKSIKSQISGFMPEVSYALGEIVETLDSATLEAGEITGHTYDNYASGAEAQKILNEATTVAAQRMNEKFPHLPGVTVPIEQEYRESSSTQ